MCAKILGATFDFKITFISHVNDICEKAKQKLTGLNGYIKRVYE